MSSKTIQIIGSLNIDLVTRTPRHPNPGETLTATSFTYGPGGKGANQAVACARLSRSKNQQQQHAPTSSSSSSNLNSNSTITIKMTGAVGSDFFGTYLLDSLKSNSVDTISISQTPDTKTGTAVIIVEESSGENRILITAGANGSVSPESIKPSLESLPNLIILQLEIPLSTVVSIIELAKAKCVDVLLNPAPAVPNLPRDVYKGLKHLIMNESEAAILSSSLGSEAPTSDEKREMGKGDVVRATDPNDNMQDLCTRFHTLGVTNVIVTLGAKGVYYSSSENGGSGHVPAAKVETVVDTTAAGDTFVGAYAVAVVGGGGAGGGKGESERLEGGKVEEAVRWANRAAAKTVEREGSMGSIPWGDEVG
ncbi:MAG: hypothetical protein Q9176_005026 [Flavoplaca citrina]